MVGVRPFAEPARRSLRPWVTAGSRPARGGWGVLPVADVIFPRVFIGVFSVLFVVDDKHLGLQPFGQALGRASGAPWRSLGLQGRPWAHADMQYARPGGWVLFGWLRGFPVPKLVSKCGPQRVWVDVGGERFRDLGRVRRGESFIGASVCT